MMALSRRMEKNEEKFKLTSSASIVSTTTFEFFIIDIISFLCKFYMIYNIGICIQGMR